MAASIWCPPSRAWRAALGRIRARADRRPHPRLRKAAHIARAALEGIAFQVMDVLHAMESDAGIRLKELRVDGGACVNNLLMQFQADLLGVPVVRPKVAETTALGAAYLAGLAVGFWKNQADIARQWQADRRFRPTMKPAQKKRLSLDWQRALGRAKAWTR